MAMLPRLFPTLAVPAAPFDPPEYSFEIKWDGTRALSTVERAGRRLCGRERFDYTARYPELDVLRRLPAGTLVDGELVACDAHGRPDLPRLLRRHGLTDPWRIRQAPPRCPVRYVVFDLLYHAGRPCLSCDYLPRISPGGARAARPVTARQYHPSFLGTFDHRACRVAWPLVIFLVASLARTA